MANLNDLAEKTEEPTILQITHPTKGEIEGLTISVLGKDSAMFRRESRKIFDRRMKKASKNKSKTIDHDERDEENQELLAKVTVGWTGFERDGAQIPCTFENVMEIYSDPGFLWLLEQVDEGVGDRERFFGN